MSCLTLKVSCCRMVSTLGFHPDICEKKKSSLKLSHCGHNFYIHSASSFEQRTAFKACSADLAHLCCDSTIDSCDFTMHKKCFRAINSLSKNNVIIITKPDEGSGIVLLHKSDYVDKMNKILDDQSKLKRLGQVSSYDNTASIESHLEKRLLD